MNSVVKIQPKDVGSIAFQEASYDIWDKKYRLIAKDGSPIDRSMDDTYKRVARALADVESEDLREQVLQEKVNGLLEGNDAYRARLPVSDAMRRACLNVQTLTGSC